MDTSRGRSRSRGSSGGRAVRARSRSRSVSVTRIPRSITLKGQHKFTRTIPLNFEVNPSRGFVDFSNVSVGTFMSFTYSMSGIRVRGSNVVPYNILTPLPNVTDFANLFDHYRIDKIEIKVISTCTDVGVQVTSNHQMPILWCFNDQDDGIAPTVQTQFLERENARVISFSDTNIKGHTVYPRTATNFYNGIALSGYGVGNKYTFLDMAYTDIEHYGTKWAYISPNNTADLKLATLQFLVKFHFTMKGVI